MDFLHEIDDHFNSFDADGEPAPPANVYIPQWCRCEHPIGTGVSTEDGEICDCGRIIPDDCARDAR